MPGASRWRRGVSLAVFSLGDSHLGSAGSNNGTLSLNADAVIFGGLPTSYGSGLWYSPIVTIQGFGESFAEKKQGLLDLYNDYDYHLVSEETQDGVTTLVLERNVSLSSPTTLSSEPDSSSNISTVPEPTTALLVLGGLALLWLQSRRSRRVIWG